MTKVLITFFILVALTSYVAYMSIAKKQVSNSVNIIVAHPTTSITQPPSNSSPLAITVMRQKSYPASAITIEQTLDSGTNYNRYVVSYMSDGLKIYGLLTVPFGQKPAGGWPVILFNHGYIPPASYSTISSYAIMVDPLAQAGYIVFKPDYRGNGNSQGTPTQSYITPDYVSDSMNALAAIKVYKDANPNKIGVFGHSMGGNITLHELVMTHDFKAAELMAGVVGDESDIISWWNQRFAANSIVGNDLDTYYVIQQMIKSHGTPATDPSYWNAIDPTQFISYINEPVQIQVGTADEDVPINFSSSLDDLLKKAGKQVNYISYPGADHNVSPDTASAMSQTVVFFNTYVK